MTMHDFWMTLPAVLIAAFWYACFWSLKGAGRE